MIKRDSANVAKEFVKPFNSWICLIIWSKIKVLIVNRGIEFQDNIIILINKYNIQIQLANSKKIYRYC